MESGGILMLPGRCVMRLRSGIRLFCARVFCAAARVQGRVRLCRCRGKWPYAEDLTADFVYIRLHGATELYTSGYSDSELDWWRARIESWRHGRQPKDARLILPGKSEPRKRDVYVYFDNDAKVHAPFDAKTLSERVRLPSIRT